MNAVRLHKKYKLISVILIAVGVLISLLPYLPITLILSKNIIKSYVMPLSWGILCCVILVFLPRVHSIGRVDKQSAILYDAMIYATILLGCRLGAGFILDGFGKSPYDLSLAGIRMNLFLIGPELIAKELIRCYCLCTFCKKENSKAFLIVTILFTASSLNYRTIFALEGTEKLVSYTAQYIAPELTRNIMLSYFGLYGGALAAITYAGILTGFQQFFPILPTLKWITEGVISISIPIIEAYAFSTKYHNAHQYKWVPKETLAGLASWILTLIGSVTFLWFVIGVFPVYPSVIATGSMKPMIHEGDVILIKRATKGEDIYSLKEGDIIQFIRDDILITHRIVEIKKDEYGNLRFKTKGDNNSSEDVRLVLPNEVRGILVRVVPKIGIPTLWIKSRGQELSEEEIEF